MNCDFLTIGEVVWDELPDGPALGGAPINVAFHVRQLGVNAEVATSVGDDQRGLEVKRMAAAAGMSGGLIQTHATLPTGQVKISFTDPTTPSYEIVSPSAWDEISASEQIMQAAADARCAVFGTLAQRSHTSRETVRRVLDAAQYRVFDVNLRAPFIDRETVEHGLAAAEMVKLNHEELDVIADWNGWDSETDICATANKLRDQFSIEYLCITIGAEGAILIDPEGMSRHQGYRVEATDAVGAGDAFLASLIHSLLYERRGDVAEVLRLANATGAFVATQHGATPSLDRNFIHKLMSTY